MAFRPSSLSIKLTSVKEQTTMRAALALTLAVAVAGLVCACTSREPEAPANTKPNTPEGLVSWYQSYWNNFNKKAWNDFKESYASNAASQQSGYGQLPVTGPDSI